MSRIPSVTFRADAYGRHEPLRFDLEYGKPIKDCHPDSFDGIFVMDSFGKIRGPAPWYVYVAKILLAVWRATGMKCLALVLPGASFTHYSYWYMLKVLTTTVLPPRFVVWISTGNDLYPLDKRTPSRDFLYDEARALLDAGYLWCAQQGLVFGGDTQAWQYQNRWGADILRKYDAMVSDIRDALMQSGYSCINGGKLLGDLVLADAIGHVSNDSPSLVDFFIVLAKWGMADDSTARYNDRPMSLPKQCILPHNRMRHRL